MLYEISPFEIFAHRKDTEDEFNGRESESSLVTDRYYIIPELLNH